MSSLILSQRRRVFKWLRRAAALPDPLCSDGEYSKSRNLDLGEMDRIELRQAWNEAELLLAALGTDDPVMYIDPISGNLITAKAWLMARMAMIRQLWKGDGRG